MRNGDCYSYVGGSNCIVDCKGCVVLPNEVYMHAFRTVLDRGFSELFEAFGLWVGGGYNLGHQPVVMWQLELPDHVYTGKYAIEPSERYDKDHAEKMAERIVQDIREQL